MPVDYLSSGLSAMWVTIAILAAGYARSRGRSPWGWFFLILIFGPLAAVFLVAMRPLNVR
jgi:hypothetical protein